MYIIIADQIGQISFARALADRLGETRIIFTTDTPELLNNEQKNDPRLQITPALPVETSPALSACSSFSKILDDIKKEKPETVFVPYCLRTGPNALAAATSVPVERALLKSITKVAALIT